MDSEKRIENLLEILREIEFIEYEDSDTGLEYFCPVCGGRPERERLSRGVRAMYPSMGGKGHNENCKLARALRGDL